MTTSLPLSRPMYSDDELLALSGLQHLAFCERQWALIHLEQVWEESAETVAGNLFHERADQPGYSTRKNVTSYRRVRLVSHRLGLYGVADIVEYEQIAERGLRITPVEYKVGSPKLEDWDRIQVAAQAMCLEEMLGTAIDEGALFYGKTRQREKVPIDSELWERVLYLANRMHELYAGETLPPVAKRARCKKCSLQNECLPEAKGRSAVEYWLDMGEKGGNNCSVY